MNKIQNHKKEMIFIAPSFACTLSLIIFLVFFVIQNVAVRHTEEGLELLFRERTQADWENVWHHEAHSRCRDKLVRQLFWACEKDIYRLTRRNRKRADESISKRTPSLKSSIWLQLNFPKSLLRTRRSGAPSITNECCTKAGCTWEEYAEYCPSNKRKNHY